MRSFVFGSDLPFQIPVEIIHRAPTTICYRKLSAFYVGEVKESMKLNQGLTPFVADLVLYNKKMGYLINFNNPTELAAFRKIVADKKIDFVAING